MSDTADSNLLTQNTVEIGTTVLKKRDAGIYKGLHESTQTFGNIGCLEAVNGNIVLRGRHGERDHIFSLEKAVEKYDDTMALVHRYALYGIKGWDTLLDIAKDFKARIKEAADQRGKLHMTTPASVLEFLAKDISTDPK